MKNIGHWREKAVLAITGVLMGLPGIFCWIHLHPSPDLETKAWGWFYLAVGGHEVLIFPIVLILIAKLYSKFDDVALSEAIMAIFKSMAQIIGTMIFISAMALKCLMQAEKEDIVLQKCGNVSVSESRSSDLRNSVLKKQ